jgi:S-adenosylmethionine:diacylglycerol 3-amino-3-carboxypropyl transferase
MPPTQKNSCGCRLRCRRAVPDEDRRVGVFRSNLIERLRERPRTRIGRQPLPDDALVAEIEAVIAELPTCGYRGAHVILKRQALVLGL